MIITYNKWATVETLLRLSTYIANIFLLFLFRYVQSSLSILHTFPNKSKCSLSVMLCDCEIGMPNSNKL